MVFSLLFPIIFQVEGYT